MEAGYHSRDPADKAVLDALPSWRSRYGQCLGEATTRRKEWRFGVKPGEPEIVTSYRQLCRNCARAYDSMKADAAAD